MDTPWSFFFNIFFFLKVKQILDNHTLTGTVSFILHAQAQRGTESAECLFGFNPLKQADTFAVTAT